jgi:hypothetical protein
MVTRRAWLILGARGWVPTTIKGWVLAEITALYLVSVAVWLVINAGVGTTLVIGVNLALALFDWHSYLTLGKRVHWSQLDTWAQVGVVMVYLMVFVAPLLVLWATIRTAWRQSQAAIAARPQEIARLERQLFGEGLPFLSAPPDLPQS